MQKKVIAVAVAAALAAPLAMANTAVTISGLVKAGVEQYKNNNSGQSSETRVSDQSSRIIFNVNEDLGGGMKAFVQLDARIATDLGAANSGGTQQWANGNTYVGVGGDSWGRVFFGRHDLHYTEAAAIEGRAGLTAPLQAFASLGPLNFVTGAAIAAGLGTRTPNVVAYESPNFSGFNGRLAYSTNSLGNEGSGVANGSKDGTWNLALRYAGGPIKAGYSYINMKTEGATDAADTRGDTLYGGYTFGAFQVGLAWNKTQNRLAASAPMTKRSAWMLPVSWQGGPHAVEAVYTRFGNRSGGAAGQVNNDTSANMWRLSYQYYLSKRTAVGVHYSHLNNKANAAYNFFGTGGANGATAAAAGEDPRQWYFGVGHAF